MLKKYGLSYSDWELLLIRQNHVCAICKRPETGKTLAVDHCHRTGKVRGLLCAKCNQGIGMFDDNASSLRTAAEYLELE